jgi:hypothetical protein
MRVMFAIISCEKDRARGCHDAIRETYMGNTPHVFFVGETLTSFTLCQDEVALRGTNDGYHYTYQKNNAIFQRMRILGYDFLFTCDVDTYVVIPRLLACGFEQHDYVGRRCDEGHAGGGYGYWLSRRAVEILASDPPNGTAAYNDLGIGMKLRDHGVFVHPRNDIFLSECPTTWLGNAVTAHLGRGTGNWNPQWMRDCHKLFQETTSCT